MIVDSSGSNDDLCLQVVSGNFLKAIPKVSLFSYLLNMIIQVQCLIDNKTEMDIQCETSTKGVWLWYGRLNSKNQLCTKNLPAFFHIFWSKKEEHKINYKVLAFYVYNFCFALTDMSLSVQCDKLFNKKQTKEKAS